MEISKPIPVPEKITKELKTYYYRLTQYLEIAFVL